MIKYRIFQIIMAVAVTLLILSFAVCMAFTARDVSQAHYNTPVFTGTDISGDRIKNGQEADGIHTGFEAWLEYSIIADGFDISNQEGFTGGNIVLCEHNVHRLNQLRAVLKKARNTIFFAVILLVIGFLVVKKRRLYECIVWGGAAGIVISAASLLLLLTSGSGFFYGLKEMIFHDNYGVFFSDQDLLISLIPTGLGLKMFLVYTGTILVGMLVTVIVRLISWKKAQPHKF